MTSGKSLPVLLSFWINLFHENNVHSSKCRHASARTEIDLCNLTTPVDFDLSTPKGPGESHEKSTGIRLQGVHSTKGNVDMAQGLLPMPSKAPL